MPPTAIEADAANRPRPTNAPAAANSGPTSTPRSLGAVQGEHHDHGDQAEPGQLDRHGGGALGVELAARDAVRERELELAGLLVVRDGAGAPADGGDRDHHEADEAEERGLHVPGAGRDLVVPERVHELGRKGGDHVLELPVRGERRVDGQVDGENGDDAGGPSEESAPAVEQRAAEEGQDPLHRSSSMP